MKEQCKYCTNDAEIKSYRGSNGQVNSEIVCLECHNNTDEELASNQLNQANAVNITSVEEKMYSREEVERIIINSFEDGYQSRVQESYGQNVYDVDDFIKDNLTKN
jgi:hypothetical protein